MGSQASESREGRDVSSFLTGKTYSSYEINFENVSITEYLKFISKIGKINFVYDEKDLDFNTTIISDQPASMASILSALVQTLRMHGLDIIANGNTMTVIQKGEPHIGTVVTDRDPLKKGQIPPIVTWVYKIKNANPQHIGRLIKPLLSDESILEVSEATRYMVVTDLLLNIEEIKKLLLTLDSTDSPLDVHPFTSRYSEPSKLVPILTEIMTPISKGNPFILVPQDGRSKLFIISTPELVKQAVGILSSLDDSPSLHAIGPITSKNILLYQIKNKPMKSIASAIEKITSDISEYEKTPMGVLVALNTMRYIPESHCVLFIGLPEYLAEVDTILSHIDVPMSKEESNLIHSTIFVYKIKHAKPNILMNSLIKITKKLESSPFPNSALIQTLKSAKLVKESGSIMFDGSPTSITKMQQILPVFDTPQKHTRSVSDFYIYKPLHHTGSDVNTELQSIAEGLKASGLDDPSFINTLLSGRWIPAANVLVFSGSTENIEKLHSILPSIDTPQLKKINEEEEGGDEGDNFMIYSLKFANGSMILKQLQEVQHDLAAAHKDKSEEKEFKDVNKALKSAKWLSSTNSLLIIAHPKTLVQIKALLDKFDVRSNMSAKSFFFLYEPKHLSPKALKEDVLNALSKMRKSGLDDYELLDALQTVSLVSDENALLFTGSEKAVAKLKNILPSLDVVNPAKTTDFFIYSPIFVTAELLHKEIKKLALDMERSDFADPVLIRSLMSLKLIQEGNSLFFTTNSANLPKIKELLKSIDSKHFSDNNSLKDQSVFILYNTKHVSGADLIEYLKNVAEDLDSLGSKDKVMIRSIKKLRLVGHSNTIIITGSRPVVEEIKALAEKFDTQSFVKKEIERITSGYVLYTPKYQKGRHLIDLMRNFESKLHNSGFQQTSLFDVIEHLKWMGDANTVIVSGHEDATKQVMALLERFDIPTTDDSELEFMTYKVQFHSGDELLTALKQIGLDFANSTSVTNKAFLEAVNRLQYIAVTNSLISTGTEEALARLNHLIQKIDIPLRQVFVEILIIETEASNQLDFGLRWGSQGKYRDKFAYSTGLNPISTTDHEDGLKDFQTKLQTLTGSTTPTGDFFPLATGYDLGVMGDIILHKGQSYFALGSLFNSLQSTDDTTIVMNQKIIAQDNKNSTFFVGQNIPYTGSFVTNDGAARVTTANLEYRDVGINLSITPTITNGDIITLAIEQEMSEVMGQAGDSSSSNSDVVTGIQTSKNTTSTVVSVPNKSFLVLSGQINNSVDEQTTSIPCLGALPFVGAFFSDVNKTRVHDNIIIFIRPQIIETFNDYKEITEHQEDLHRSDSGNPEAFDAGLELLKTADDY
ncbi:hypothetical protein COB21_05955 [Candidatus Aerophobetes bacterium]|uniref:NolW-like domain-containing protein n=1 Tax=Aerophobetes bacterium TaxID=2030807 RepID=A0A2A4WXN8_UNCAE|nr:MAG: hypothetical protein COB21_05955 [Candidatus Aerophobetes bacterium]